MVSKIRCYFWDLSQNKEHTINPVSFQHLKDLIQTLEYPLGTINYTF